MTAWLCIYVLLVPEVKNNKRRKKSVHGIDDIVKLLLDAYQLCLKAIPASHELPY